MTAPTTIPEAIEQNALGPKSATDGVHSMTRHSLKDQIAADNHVKNATAEGKNHFGMRFVKIVPPATGGQSQ